MSNLQIKGNWEFIKEKLKQANKNLNDEDLTYIQGKEDELLGRLKDKTGKTREEILEQIKQYEQK